MTSKKHIKGLIAWNELETGDVVINLTILYDFCNKKEDMFIYFFGQMLTHEICHREIGKILEKKDVPYSKRLCEYLVGEERVVRHLCDQPFSKKTREDYEKLQRKNIKLRNGIKRMVCRKR